MFRMPIEPTLILANGESFDDPFIATPGQRYQMQAVVEFDTPPKVGERVDFYIGASPTEDVGVSQFVGSLISHSSNTSVMENVVGFFTAPPEHGHIIVKNETSGTVADYKVEMTGIF